MFLAFSLSVWRIADVVPVAIGGITIARTDYCIGRFIEATPAATVAARLGLECVIYMGAVDIARQEANVYRMRLLGARVEEVESGSKTLKDTI